MRRIKPKLCGNHCTKVEHLDVTLDQNPILHDINFHLYCGEMLTIIGKNGAGKSTLMKALLGEIPYKGRVVFEDMRNGRKSRIKIGYVPQHLAFDKNTPTTVYDFFASCISRKPVWLMKDKKVYGRIKEELARFQAEELIDQCLGDLSGGELQRVMLSVATCPMPNLLLLDEPISGVDRNGTLRFYDLLDELKNRYDLSILMISHDLDLVYEYSDRVILLDKTVEAEGSPAKVYKTEIFQETFGRISYGRPGNVHIISTLFLRKSLPVYQADSFIFFHGHYHNRKQVLLSHGQKLSGLRKPAYFSAFFLPWQSFTFFFFVYSALFPLCGVFSMNHGLSFLTYVIYTFIITLF